MLYEEINVAVDSGKGFSKFLVKDSNSQEFKKAIFPTKIQKVSNVGYDLSRNSYLVEYNGESYLIGEMINENLVNADLTKKTKEHLLCIYSSIANAIKASKGKPGIYKVNLAINTPLTVFKNNKLKEEYGEFIRRKGETIHIIVNGKPFHFKINNIYLLQEGIGSLFVRKNDFKDKTVTQIDIGTLNVTVSSYKKLIPQFDSNFSNNLGTNSLFSTIRERLSMDFGVTVHYKDIEQIMKDRILVIEGEKMAGSTDVIEEVLENHAKQIVASVKSQISLNNTEIAFVGGGSILLKEQLQKLFPHSNFEQDPQFCSLMSFYRIMEAKLHAKIS